MQTIKSISDNILSIQLLQALPVAVYTCDVRGSIQLFNEAAVELWGKKPVPGVDKWCGAWKLYKADGSPIPPEEGPMARVLKGATIAENEELILEKPGGEKRFILANPRPLFDEAGQMSGAINLLVDITERKRGEIDTSRLAAIVQNSDDAIISKNLDGFVLTWNPAAERLFGYTAEEMIGQPILKLIPPDRLDEENYIMEQITGGNLVDHFTTKRQKKDGTLLDISLTISPIKDRDGKVIGASKIARDITRSRIEEEKLRKSEKNLKELANAMPQLVWITDSKGSVTYFNERVSEYNVPAPPDEIWNWPELLHPEDHNATVKEWKRAIEKSTIFMKEHRFHMADGNYRWHLTRVMPFVDEHGVITKWIGSATDIDDMKTMALRKDDFLSVASHELRTPITSIKAYSQLLSETYRNSNDSFLKNALLKLEIQSNKMTKLVTDFLKLSKIESGKLQLTREKFLINDLVREVVGEIQFVSVNHKIILKEEGEAVVNADRERISQVLANFLNNAIKYSPGADEVVVVIQPYDSDVRVSVIDKGIGINREDHERIFERFYRATSNANIPFSGFGIGLYISAEIIRRHDGEIGVKSEAGKGSTFYFHLPIAK